MTLLRMSHELKTPLAPVTALRKRSWGTDEPDGPVTLLGGCRLRVPRLSHLVLDLVDLSRLQGDDPMQYAQEVDIDSVLIEAVDSMRTTAQAKPDRHRRRGDRHAKCSVSSQLVTAVRNLLANAVSYSGEQTRITLGCRIAPDHCGSRSRTGAWDSLRQAVGSLNASTEVDQARSRDTGRTGLGLSIVKRVHQNHGSSVSGVVR